MNELDTHTARTGHAGNTTPKPLTPKQRATIVALMTSSTYDDAARAAGVNVASIRRWLNDARFCAELRGAERDALAVVTRRLTAMANNAADALADALKDDNPPAIRTRAADIVIGRLMNLRDVFDFNERLAALETAQAAKDGAE